MMQHDSMAPSAEQIAGLAPWLRVALSSDEDVTVVRELAGGTQNVMLELAFGQRRMILRRPPRFPRENSNDVLRREMRLLGALAPTDVPHPHLIAACPDVDVLGVAFYVMEVVDGFNASLGLPALHAADPAVRHAMSIAAVEGIAKLSKLDPDELGLGDFGRFEGFYERQAGRWKKQYESYLSYQGWPGLDALPGTNLISNWLSSNLPRDRKRGIIHGDYHLANMMFSNEGPDLAAIVDWELATIGDPMLDLGWLIATLPRAESRINLVEIEPSDGFATAAELSEAYAVRTGRDLGELRWFAILACYKLAMIIEGTHARACAGLAEKANGERLHANATLLCERALAWIDGAPF